MNALHFLFSFKSGDRVAIHVLAFLPPILRVNPPKRLVSASRILFILKLFYKFLYLFSGAI